MDLDGDRRGGHAAFFGVLWRRDVAGSHLGFVRKIARRTTTTTCVTAMRVSGIWSTTRNHLGRSVPSANEALIIAWTAPLAESTSRICCGITDQTLAEPWSS